MSTNLNSDSFSNGTPTLLFDFPILAPGGVVTQAFDSVNSVGLFQLQWDEVRAGRIRQYRQLHSEWRMVRRRSPERRQLYRGLPTLRCRIRRLRTGVDHCSGTVELVVVSRCPRCCWVSSLDSVPARCPAPRGRTVTCGAGAVGRLRCPPGTARHPRLTDRCGRRSDGRVVVEACSRTFVVTPAGPLSRWSSPRVTTTALVTNLVTTPVPPVRGPSGSIRTGR